MPITTELIAFGATVFCAIAGVWWHVESRFDTRMKDAERERRDIRADLAAYKVHVATNHVSAQTLQKTEERLILAIDKLGNRLEAIVARLDQMSR